MVKMYDDIFDLDTIIKIKTDAVDSQEYEFAATARLRERFLVSDAGVIAIYENNKKIKQQLRIKKLKNIIEW